MDLKRTKQIDTIYSTSSIIEDFLLFGMYTRIQHDWLARYTFLFELIQHT